MPITCSWYAMCANPAAGTAAHPILRPAPICDRCATKHELTITLYPKAA